MTDWIPPELIDFSPVGLLGLFVLLMMIGRIHTDRAYRAMENAYQKQVEVAEKLRETNALQARTIDKQQDALSERRTLDDVVKQTMRAIRQEALEGGDTNGPIQ